MAKKDTKAKPNTPQPAGQGGTDAAPRNASQKAPTQAPQETVNAAPGTAGQVVVLGPVELADMLAMAGVTAVDPRDIKAWDDATRLAAQQWAVAVHLSASDNDVTVPDMPAAVAALVARAAGGDQAVEDVATERPALMVRTKARNGRRRRAGFVFTGQPYGIDLDALTAEQIAAVKADPMLVVEEVAYPAEATA